MQLRKTLILVAVALALVLFIVFIERFWESTDDIDRRKGLAFPGLSGRTGEADAIRIIRGPDKVVLVKRRGLTGERRWYVTQPVDCRADGASVKMFLDAFAEALKLGMAKGELERPLSPTDMNEYGLDRSVRVVISAGRERLLDAIVEGRPVPKARKHVFAAPYKRDRVFAVDEKLRDEALKHVDGFRDKRLLELTAGRVTGVEILEDERPVAELARGRDSRWRVVSPVSDRADGMKADEIVDRMGALWADRFEMDFALDDTEMAKGLARYGLVPSKRSVKITREVGNETVRHELLFGNRIRKTESGRAPSYDVYAMLKGTRTVVLIPEAMLEVVDVEPDDLRDRRVAEFHPDEVRELRIGRFAGDLRLEKKDGKWLVTDPEECSADKDRVDGLLKEFANIRVLKFLPFETSLTRPILVEAVLEAPKDDEGQATPRGGATGEARKEYIFFEPDETGPDGDPPPGGENTIRGRRGKSGAVFEVASAILGRLRAGVLHYRDRTVIEVDEGRVVRLTITSGGKRQSAVLVVGKWKPDPAFPADGVEIDQFLAHEIKWGLSGLRALKFVGKPTGQELARRGLDPAEVRVEAGLRPEKAGEPEERIVLLVGRPLPPSGEVESEPRVAPGSSTEATRRGGDAGKKYYAKLEGDPMVFLVGENVVKNLRAGFVKQR